MITTSVRVTSDFISLLYFILLKGEAECSYTGTL